MDTYDPEVLESSDVPVKKAGPDKANRYFFTALAVLTVILLGSFLLVALSTFFNKTDLRQQAATSSAVIIRYNPASLAVTVGQEFTVPVELVTGGKSIAVAEVLPAFDKTFFQPVSLVGSTFLATTLVPATITTAGDFTSLLVAKPIAIPPSGVTGQGQIALAKFKALKAGTSNITFDQTKTRAPEFNGEPENIVGTYGPVAVTVSAGTTQTPEQICTQSGGTWKSLPTACVDRCSAIEEDSICATVVTQGCDCGSAKCTNDSGSCVTNPEATPSTASSNLKIQFKLGGLKKEGVQVPATVTVKYTASGSAAVVKQYGKTYTSTTSGTLASGTPLNLTGIELNEPVSNVEVYVKTPTSLQKKIGTLTLKTGANELLTTTELFVGDFNQDTDQANVFNILDVAKMLAQYKELNNPITDTNRSFDVNFDDNFNVLDTSYVIKNYQTLVLQGQEP